MLPTARLTILFDCCHSGSAVELPYVYRPDSHGQVNLIDNVKTGITLARQAMNLVHGGFSAAKIPQAKEFFGNATSFFKNLTSGGGGGGEELNEDGLGEEKFVEDWKNEGKDVWMFSGCAECVFPVLPGIFTCTLGVISVSSFSEPTISLHVRIRFLGLAWSAQLPLSQLIFNYYELKLTDG
jgi:hypothetical protein